MTIFWFCLKFLFFLDWLPLEFFFLFLRTLALNGLVLPLQRLIFLYFLPLEHGRDRLSFAVLPLPSLPSAVVGVAMPPHNFHHHLSSSSSRFTSSSIITLTLLFMILAASLIVLLFEGSVSVSITLCISFDPVAVGRGT